MIELTPEQRRAVEQGEPVRVVDPTTHGAYVVVRAEVFEGIANASQPPAQGTAPDIAPNILRSMQAYWRELPELLKTRRNQGKWVAYHGEERVGVGADDVSLIRELLRRAVPEDAYYLATIRPREVPPWEPEEVEPLGDQHLEDS